MKRREFIETSALAAAGLTLGGCLHTSSTKLPTYLQSHKSEYKRHPRQAALKWFREARYGLFIHYGLYSILGRHEWVQFKERIPVAEYAKLKDRFTAEEFDADFITDLVLESEMKYINITTRHHDSFCLFDSKYTDFKSTHSPAKRDLVAELSEQCHKKGVALFLYYSHGRDWRHPHAPNNEKWGGNARPKYETREPFYKYGTEHDLNIYLEFMSNQIQELLTNYGPIAGIWLDGHATPVSGDSRLFKLPELYEQIHLAQPQVLVSYKQGVIGTEDFLAPERKYQAEGLPPKPLEICDHMQKKGWGYLASQDGKHKTAEDVVAMLQRAHSYPANLLLNTGPYASGKIPDEDVQVFRKVGREIRDRGWEDLLATTP